jgi:hypothetical protein
MNLPSTLREELNNFVELAKTEAMAKKFSDELLQSCNRVASSVYNYLS